MFCQQGKLQKEKQQMHSLVQNHSAIEANRQTDVVGVWGEEGFFWLCFINKSLLLNPEDIFSDRYIYVTLLPCYHMPGKFVLLFIPVKIMVSSSFSSLAFTLHC